MRRMRSCALNAASRSVGKTSERQKTTGIYRPPKLMGVWVFGLQWPNGFKKLFPLPCASQQSLQTSICWKFFKPTVDWHRCIVQLLGILQISSVFEGFSCLIEFGHKPPSRIWVGCRSSGEANHGEWKAWSHPLLWNLHSNYILSKHLVTLKRNR